MIRDRGNKKWTAMMLTEHVKEIRDWYESDNDIPEPDYDEFDLNALAEELNIAFQTKSNVRITYWVDKREKEVEGQITDILPHEQSIKVNHTKLMMKHIIKVDIYD